jgi:hypothetical protein
MDSSVNSDIALIAVQLQHKRVQQIFPYVCPYARFTDISTWLGSEFLPRRGSAILLVQIETENK